MYRINSIHSGQWEIIDETGRVVFVGTPDECEETLDYHENVHSQRSLLSVWFEKLFGRKQTNSVMPRDSRAAITPRTKRVPQSWPDLRIPRAH